MFSLLNTNNSGKTGFGLGIAGKGGIGRAIIVRKKMVLFKFVLLKNKKLEATSRSGSRVAHLFAE